MSWPFGSLQSFIPSPFIEHNVAVQCQIRIENKKKSEQKKKEAIILHVLGA